jgi:hypothetical protein
VQILLRPPNSFPVRASLAIECVCQRPDPLLHADVDRVRRRVDEFDILHFQVYHLHSPLFRDLAARTVTTLHGRQDLPDLPPLYFGFGEMPMVSVSYAQREPLPQANVASTVLPWPSSGSS